MIEKKLMNNELEIECTSYIDNKQNIWFRGKDIALAGYCDTDKAISFMLMLRTKNKVPPKRVILRIIPPKRRVILRGAGHLFS